MVLQDTINKSPIVNLQYGPTAWALERLFFELLSWGQLPWAGGGSRSPAGRRWHHEARAALAATNFLAADVVRYLKDRAADQVWA